MPDFNQVGPPKSVTNPNPNTPEGAAYPKHLYKFGEDDGSVVVAWDGKKPIHNTVVSVNSESEEAKAVKDGYHAKPVLEGPKEPKGKGGKD